jgi:hypothetical protein
MEASRFNDGSGRGPQEAIHQRAAKVRKSKTGLEERHPAFR